MSEKYSCHVVFQTHWDREWYLPFEEYRYRFTQVIDRVVDGLESGDIDSFVLDGQTAAIEDYFEICEESKRKRIQKLIDDKKIIVGPWYVMADEFLVQGECLIRNLEIGTKQSREYGNLQMVGYLPDTFGHIGQMPQILKGFDIDNIIMWRGIKPKSSELIWEGSDDTNLFTIFLPEGYYQPVIDQPEYEKLIDAYIEKVKPYSTTGELLLTNGGDHLMPAFTSIKERIEKLNEKYENIDFNITSYENYIDILKNKTDENSLEKYKGELRDNDHIYILPNVLSTRTYLKEQNQRIEDELMGYTEPLVALAYNNEEEYPKRYLEQSWKYLLLNHPHDSICGCSVDSVHREMETRTMKLEQRLHAIQKGAFHKRGWMEYTLWGSGANREILEDNSVFTVFNPHPYNYCGKISGTIWLDKENPLNDGFSIESDNGNNIKVSILKKYEDRYFTSPTDGTPKFKDGYFYEIVFYVDNFKPTSLKSFKLVKAHKNVLTLEKTNTIENDEIKLTVENNGTVTVFDKNKNIEYVDLNKYYSSLDNGDEYNYSKPENDKVTFASLIGDIEVVNSHEAKRIKYQLGLNLPECLSADRKSASENIVTTTINIELTLYNNESLVHSEIKVNNKAKDQRLRVKFPLGTTIDNTYSDSAFDVVERQANRVEQFKAEKIKEVEVVVDPTLSMVKAEKDGKGIVLYQRGLQEYQTVLEENQSVLELTVIRSVGWLSRDDFDSRGGGAGPNLPSPEGQCIGEYEFKYAFTPMGTKTTAQYLTGAHLYRVPLRIYSGHVTTEESLVGIDNAEIQWSAIRKVDNKLEVRLWNPTCETKEFKIISDNEISNISLTMLNGQKIDNVSLDGKIAIQAKKIMTLSIEYK